MSQLTVLFVADICGQPGRQAASYMIKPLVEQHGVDYVIANVENAAGGFGVTPEMSTKMFSYGIDMQTSGNHIWDRYEILKYLYDRPKLLRPANFPNPAPGLGWYIDKIGETRIATVSLMGRTYMKMIDCPFQAADRIVERIREQTPNIIVDFHAEATSEKQAMMHHLDGRVSAILGTHTHVQTADEQVTGRGTGYITDCGMTGPHDSVIGMQKEPSLKRFLTGLPKRFATATDDIKLSGVLLKINGSDGACKSIERLRLDFDLDAWLAQQRDKREDGEEDDSDTTTVEQSEVEEAASDERADN